MKYKSNWAWNYPYQNYFKVKRLKNGAKQNVILNKWEIGVSNYPVLQKATLLE
ncbi:hypothetical protein [uncultured Roseivirga sp.]|uniref:hypothetical protein n=1 Tax=uncultured Roseivirga sp. TaxID=543088 RepID=UPI002586A84A|nr:hypothetical protein [uncultured Roseivirga sp.]